MSDVLKCPTSLYVRQIFEKSVLICPTSLNVRQIFEESVLICPTSLNVRQSFEKSVLICPTSLYVRQIFEESVLICPPNFLKKVSLYVRLHEMSSYFFPHCSQTILICPQHVAVWVQVGRRCGAARHGNCKSCSGSFAPVRSFLTPGLLPLFSTVTGRCLVARTSHYICSSMVTARHHFRPPDFSKQFREKSY
jgi:hypothetical protein